MNATKRNGRKARSVPIGKAEALQILESAVMYCKQAGLDVRAGNVGGALALTIGGAALAHDPARFVPTEPEAVMAIA